MAEPLSPLEPVWHPGRHGRSDGAAGVTLSETRPASIVQVSAWPGEEKAVMAAIGRALGLTLPDGAGGGVSTGAKAAFGIGPGKFLVVNQAEGLDRDLGSAIPMEIGTVTGLSHGRTAIRVSGPRSEWVLAKLFAVDFALFAFPIGSGKATQHHDVFAQIQRTGPEQFDLYIFRSFARSFWKTLCHAAEEVGYEVK